MKVGTVSLAVAAVALTVALVPAAEASTRKIPVEVVAPTGADTSAVSGRVESDVRRCVDRVDVYATFYGRSVKTNAQGEFEFRTSMLANRDFNDTQAEVKEGPKFGPRGHRKQCQGAKRSIDMRRGRPDVVVQQYSAQGGGYFRGYVTDEPYHACEDSLVNRFSLSWRADFQHPLTPKGSYTELYVDEAPFLPRDFIIGYPDAEAGFWYLQLNPVCPAPRLFRSLSDSDFLHPGSGDEIFEVG